MRILIFTILGHLFFSCHSSRNALSQEQMNLYTEISNYHQEQVAKDQPIQFYKNERVQQIILIRHGLYLNRSKEHFPTISEVVAFTKKIYPLIINSKIW